VVASSVLVFVLAFAVLFSMLSVSGLLAKENTEKLYDVLATKTVEASMWRLKNLEKTCFELDSATANSYPFLAELIREADFNTMSPGSEDRYDGYSTGVEGSDAMPLVRSLGFDHSVEEKSVRNISDKVHMYSCNVEYGGNLYFLQIKFYAVSHLNEYAGYLPITITDDLLRDAGQEPTNSTVFRWFNNTAVWDNKSDSWMTLHLIPDLVDEIPAAEMSYGLEPVTVKLPPFTARDFYLGSRFSPADIVYHYQIQEYPWIQGDISLKHAPRCMDFDTARSLYSATKFPFMAPTYSPDGYEYKCMQADTSSVEMWYANQTFPPQFMGEGLAEGQIQIRIYDTDRYFGIETPPGAPQTDEEKIRSQYESILENNPVIRPQLVDINGNLGWANEASPNGTRQTVVFPDGTQLVHTSAMPARLRFYDTGTGISLEGYMPAKELVKMARSLE
jgi:hypothetical protein